MIVIKYYRRKSENSLNCYVGFECRTCALTHVYFNCWTGHLYELQIMQPVNFLFVSLVLSVVVYNESSKSGCRCLHLCLLNIWRLDTQSLMTQFVVIPYPMYRRVAYTSNRSFYSRENPDRPRPPTCAPPQYFKYEHAYWSPPCARFYNFFRINEE